MKISIIDNKIVKKNSDKINLLISKHPEITHYLDEIISQIELYFKHITIVIEADLYLDTLFLKIKPLDNTINANIALNNFNQWWYEYKYPAFDYISVELL